jgi:hypothetical protein
MREPQPALMLLLVQALALAAVVGWWLTLPSPQRLWRLGRIMVVEQVPTPPPATLAAQAWWLVQYRLQRLRGMAALGALASIIGGVEGWERRRRHPFGGVGVMRLALGQLGATLTVGAAGALLLLPWPLPLVPAAAGLGLLVGLTLYLLAAGKPLIR